MFNVDEMKNDKIIYFNLISLGFILADASARVRQTKVYNLVPTLLYLLQAQPALIDSYMLY